MEVSISRETVVKSTFIINLEDLDVNQFLKIISSVGEVELPNKEIKTPNDLIQFLENTDQLSEIFNALQNISVAAVNQLEDDYGDENYFFIK
jgi:hypothetical protein